MRILLASNSPYYPSLGGGNKSNRLLMEALARQGHRVRVVSRTRAFGAEARRELLSELERRGVPYHASPEAVRMEVGGVEVCTLSGTSGIRSFFAARAAEFRPDVILASTDDPAHLMLDAALAMPDVRVVYLIRATVALPFGPDSALPSPAKTAELRRVDGAVGVSEYVAEYARRWGGMEAVHVPISLLEPREWPCLGRFENRYVTMINPCAVKGISIFLALADRLPGVEFAAAPTWGTSETDLAELKARPNVTILPPAEDVDQIFALTRIALVPSLWAEARSRVILEAMARGIPVLAGNVGGLAEAMLGMDYLLPVNPVRKFKPAVDDLMVPVAEIPPQDAGPWQAALQRLISDRAHYEDLSARSRGAALAYAATLTVHPFEEYLKEILRAPRKRSDPTTESQKPVFAAAAVLSPEKQKILAMRLKQRLSAKTSWLPESLAARRNEAGARTELAKFATEKAQQAVADTNIEILWDGMWICRAGAHFFPMPRLFDGLQPDWRKLTDRAKRCRDNAEDYWFYVYKPQPGDVIVDVGAGQGEDVLAFSLAVGPAGRVLALEPHPESFAILETFCRLNRLSNVTPRNVACMESRGEVAMETMAVWESNFVRRDAPSAVKVCAMPLDDVCAEAGVAAIDFLKMNIEGAERWALPGCRKVLPHTRYVCVAAHDFRADRGEGEQFRTFHFVCRFLREAGFQLVTRDTDPRYFVPYHVHGFRSDEGKEKNESAC
jgi:FkbM family methyltransferase